MRTTSETTSPAAANIVLWSVAAEPVILAGIALFMKKSGAVQRVAEPVFTTLLIVFAIVSLGLLYVSFALASGKHAPKDGQPPLSAGTGVTRLFGFRIIAIALASAPAVLGFVLFVISGNDWVLPVFNGGALLVAGRHLLAFSEASR